MPSHTPLVVLLAGPNGAGKSTSAARLKGALAVEESQPVIADSDVWNGLKEHVT